MEEDETNYNYWQEWEFNYGDYIVRFSIIEGWRESHDGGKTWLVRVPVEVEDDYQI